MRNVSRDQTEQFWLMRNNTDTLKGNLAFERYLCHVVKFCAF